MPRQQESGEFFLARYRKIDPQADIILPEKIRSAIRVNTVKVDEGSLLESLRRRDTLLEKIPWLRHGYFADARFSLGSTPQYLLGHYYLQGPLSQLACEALDPERGSVVLDMASAPGGKTTYLAAMAKRVVALDFDAKRLASVRNNVERLGLANVVCLKKDARFAFDLGREFLYIMLDAPCSGNFCSDPSWFSKRTIHDIRASGRRQREFMRAAVQCLQEGGRLLYSTCSLEPEEDELVVDWALRSFPELDIVPLELPLGDSGITSWDEVALDPRIAGTRRFWPHKTGMEGFYMALFVRKCS